MVRRRAKSMDRERFEDARYRFARKKTPFNEIKREIVLDMNKQKRRRNATVGRRAKSMDRERFEDARYRLAMSPKVLNTDEGLQRTVLG